MANISVNITELKQLLEATPASHNIMLVGNHGIGKSEILTEYFGAQGMPVVAKKSLCQRTKPLTNRKRSSSVLRQVVLSVCLYWGSSSLNRCERAWFS